MTPALRVALRKGRRYVTGIDWDTGLILLGDRLAATHFATVQEAATFAREHGLRPTQGWRLEAQP